MWSRCAPLTALRRPRSYSPRRLHQTVQHSPDDTAREMNMTDTISWLSWLFPLLVTLCWWSVDWPKDPDRTSEGQSIYPRLSIYDRQPAGAYRWTEGDADAPVTLRNTRMPGSYRGTDRAPDDLEEDEEPTSPSPITAIGSASSSSPYNFRSRSDPRSEPEPGSPDNDDNSNDSESNTEPNIASDDDENDSDYEPSVASSLPSSLAGAVGSVVRSWSIDSSWFVPTQSERRSIQPMIFVGQLKPFQEEDAATIIRNESRVNEDLAAGRHPRQLGFILAYMMGLGKTVVSIYLVCQSSAEARRLKMPTLIICPNAPIARQWRREFRKFAPHGRILFYHGSAKGFARETAEQLREYDVVITTYYQVNVQRKNKLAFEEKERRQADHTSLFWPFFFVLWYWVILDESHLIRKWNRKRPGKLVQATMELDKKHGLCLTGTPMQNAPADLYPQLLFLGLNYEELNKQHNCDHFERVRFRWFQEQSSTHDENFMDIIGNTCIVRTDRSPSGEIRVDLPLKTVHTIQIPLSPLERELYSLVDKLFVDVNVLARLMRQRQACVLPHLLPRKITEEFEPDTFNSLRVDQEEDVDVQRAAADVPARSFYSAERLTLEGLRPELQTVIDPAYVSAKIRVAMGIVEDWRSRPTHGGPPNKIIIYSWFRATIRLFDRLLTESEIGHTIFNGATTEKQKDAALTRITEDPKCTVLLMSIQAGSVGLNITSCNVVIFLEPWWNPFVEEQACGRVWRIGQERPVTIYKLIASDTIEDSRITKTQQLKLNGVESVLRDIRK